MKHLEGAQTTDEVGIYEFLQVERFYVIISMTKKRFLQVFRSLTNFFGLHSPRALVQTSESRLRGNSLMPSLGDLNADAFRRLAEDLTLRDKILELRLVSKTCLKHLTQMGTECLTLNMSGKVTRWSERDVLRCGRPGSIRHFRVRSLKLEELSRLEVAVLQRLLTEARESMSSLAVSAWCPNLKIETSQGSKAIAMYSTCEAFHGAREIKELRWFNPKVPLPLSLHIISSLRRLVSLHLTLSGVEIGDDTDVLQLQVLRNLPELRKLILDGAGDYEGKFCSWMGCVIFDPLTPLALALTPLEHLQILHWGEVPLWVETEGLEALVEMLKRKTLVELKTLAFSTLDFWDLLRESCGPLSSLKCLRLAYSEVSSDDFLRMVEGIAGLLVDLEVLELHLVNMEDDAGMVIDDWQPWLLQTLGSLRGAKLKRLRLEGSIDLDLAALQNRLAANDIELVTALDE